MATALSISDFLRRTPLLQSEAWEGFQRSLGNTTQRIQGQLAILQPTALPTIKYWYLPRVVFEQPITLPDSGDFLRIECRSDEAVTYLKSSGKTRKQVPIQPPTTLVTALPHSFTEFPSTWKQKHRYNLGVANRSDLAVEIITNPTPESIERFWKLLSTTAQRQQFRTHNESYYARMISEFLPQGMAVLVFVTHQHIDLACMILTLCDRVATYLHGGSSELERQRMAPYLLHASAMEYAITQGCQWYDWWGIDEAPAGSNSSLAGVTRFKMGFGGEVIHYPSCYDLISKPLTYGLYSGLRALRPPTSSFHG